MKATDYVALLREKAAAKPDSSPTSLALGIAPPPTEVNAASAVDESARDPVQVAQRWSAEKKELGLTNKALAERLGVSESFVGKRLALLSAPRGIQDMVQRGVLGETTYYNHKDTLHAAFEANLLTADATLAQIADLTQHGRRRTRALFVSIPYDVALEICRDYAHVLAKRGQPSIQLGAQPTRRQIQTILNTRAGDLRELP